MARTPAIDRRLQRLASAFTPEWLSGQRWFRGKSRGLMSVELLDGAELAGSPGWLLVLECTDEAGATARYLVPAVPEGDSGREPRDGDGVWRALAFLVLGGGEVAGAQGRWIFTPTYSAAALLPGGLAALPSRVEHRLDVQQSNSWVVLGEALILKLYRLVEAGTNPEVEMNAFLTTVGFDLAPALAGTSTYLLGDEPHSAAMLQQLVPAAGDGWRWMLGRLAAGPRGGAEALGQIESIGRLTAAMHAALASRPETPGFPSRVATSAERTAWRAAAEDQLTRALRAVGEAERARLAAVADRITTRLAPIDGSAAMRVSRIHGDYHLGQLLRTADGFRVIDFEGEPARTLAERRAPASPLRDLAGMLRSLDYAAQTAGAPGRWLADARTAFLGGYGPIGVEGTTLLAAFELEKACYEVAYEANNRPDWVWLPLGALERQGPSD
jgi:predicted trehalose synthase